MDPNLFAVDWARTTEVLAVIVLLSFVVERALSLLFESRFFLQRFERRSLKELIAFGVGVAVCWYWQFDAVSIILVSETTGMVGYILTGAVIAGGSKGSIALFHDFFDWKSGALRERERATSSKPQEETSKETSGGGTQ